MFSSPYIVCTVPTHKSSLSMFVVCCVYYSLDSQNCSRFIRLHLSRIRYLSVETLKVPIPSIDSHAWSRWNTHYYNPTRYSCRKKRKENRRDRALWSHNYNFVNFVIGKPLHVPQQQTVRMSPLHQQNSDAQVQLPLKMESRSTLRISSRMEGNRLVSKDEDLCEDFMRMGPAMMKLPQLKMSRDYFRMNNSEQTLSPSSLIDGALEILGSNLLEDDCISDDEVMVVPVKTDNYRSKRSSRLARREDKRRNELLLDNAFAIEDALNALHDGCDASLSSGDEESHSESGYESDL